MRHVRLLTGCALACGLLFAAEGDSKIKIRNLKDAAKQGSAGIGRIMPLLTDEDVEVRREAARALVEVGTQRSLEGLVVACHDKDAEVQIRATDGLVNFYLPGYVKHGFSASLKRAGNAVSGHWLEPSNDEAVDPDTPLRPEIVKALTELLENGASIDARANAARALGVLRARAAVPVLSAGLKSKDSRLMYESLIALASWCATSIPRSRWRRLRPPACSAPKTPCRTWAACWRASRPRKCAAQRCWRSLGSPRRPPARP
jgi:hypothetical protein